MAYLSLLAIIQILLAIHALKTGRNMYWLYLIALTPAIGAIAYVIVELIPELSGNFRARQAMRGIRQTLDPRADLRRRAKEHKLSGSVDTTRHLANELADKGQFQEAIQLYENALTGIYATDPNLLLGLAQTQFAARKFADAKASLDLLIENNPDFKSQDGHLLYARSVELCGDDVAARHEYEAVVQSFAGAEAKCRYAEFLEKAGDRQGALEQFSDILETAELSPRHYGRAQKVWIAEARNGVKRLQ